MEPKLLDFYFNCMLPEIIDSRRSRSLPIKEPDYVVKAQNEMKERKKSANDVKEAGHLTENEKQVDSSTGKVNKSIRSCRKRSSKALEETAEKNTTKRRRMSQSKEARESEMEKERENKQRKGKNTPNKKPDNKRDKKKERKKKNLKIVNEKENWGKTKKIISSIRVDQDGSTKVKKISSILRNRENQKNYNANGAKKNFR